MYRRLTSVDRKVTKRKASANPQAEGSFAVPPFHENYKLTRDLTPLYLSSWAEIEYIDLVS
jgi:hypothetical protein